MNGIRQLQKSLLNGVDDRPTLSELLPPDASILDVDKEHIKNLPRFDAAEDAEVLLCASETGFDLGVKRLRKALERGDSSITLHGKQLHCLGFDTERTPTFRLGQPEQPVACLQLASHDLVVLIFAEEHEAYTGLFTRPVGGPLCFKGRCCVIGGHERVIEARARLDCSWAC